MEIDFDMERRQMRLLAPSTGHHAPAPLDWHGLRARMAAGYAARPVLNGIAAAARTGIAAASFGGGSFDRDCARALVTYGMAAGGGLCAVNPTALANCNADGDNGGAVAGPSSVSDRG